MSEQSTEYGSDLLRLQDEGYASQSSLPPIGPLWQPSIWANLCKPSLPLIPSREVAAPKPSTCARMPHCQGYLSRRISVDFMASIESHALASSRAGR